MALTGGLLLELYRDMTVYPFPVTGKGYNRDSHEIDSKILTIIVSLVNYHKVPHSLPKILAVIVLWYSLPSSIIRILAFFRTISVSGSKL